MTIPDSLIEEIRQRADLVEIVSEHTRLKRSGRTFRGPCPLHGGEGPNFSVDPAKNIFKCFTCLHEAEPVWTDRGLVPIREVQPGDGVLDLRGEVQRVLQVHTRAATVISLELAAVRGDALRLTRDHPCLVVGEEDAVHCVPMLYRQAGRGTRFQRRRREYRVERRPTIRQAPAADIVPGDYLLFPVVPASRRRDAPLPADLAPEGTRGKRAREVACLPVNPRTAWLYGLWIAEGSRFRGGVTWTLGIGERHLAEEVVRILGEEFGTPASVHERVEGNSLQVTCSNTHLSLLFPRWFGRGAAHKRIPWEALFWTPACQSALLAGYLEGDGRRVAPDAWSATTVSETLAYGVYALSVQAGRPASLRVRRGVTRAGRDGWYIGLPARERTTGFFWPIDGREYFWTPVVRVGGDPLQAPVVDLTVTGSHTFVTKFGAVHNCGEGGDLFSFPMKQLGMGFLEAVRYVAERAGVEIPEAPERRPEEDPNARLHEANAFAADWFQKRLRDPEAGAEARAYLERRGIGAEAAERFGLGWAPESWTSLGDAARAHGISNDVLLALGLVKESTKGGRESYDAFRGRLVFPIEEPGGRVIAFGGRVIGEVEEHVPKYLNSPESPVYHKGEVLYGLRWSRGAIRRSETALVVEGYMDYVSLAAHGVENVVAPLGTAFTPRQAELLARYAQRVILLYDSDTAGLKATFRSADELLRAGVEVQVATLPQGEDPDSVVRRGGGEALRAYLKDAVDVLERKIQILERGNFFGSIAGTRQAIDKLLPTVRLVTDDLLRDVYLTRIAERTGVPRASLEREAKGGTGDAPAPADPRERRHRTGGRRAEDRGGPPAGPGPGYERMLLLLMVNVESLVEQAVQKVGPEDLVSVTYRELFSHLVEFEGHRDPDGEWLQGLPPSVVHLFEELQGDASWRNLSDVQRQLSAAIDLIRLRRYERKLDEIDGAIRAALPEEQEALQLEKASIVAEMRREGLRSRNYGAMDAGSWNPGAP